MGKRERKINVINQYIHNVSSFATYGYGQIPEGIANNAIISYGGAISKEDIWGLVDTTITGNGRNGLIFTEYGIYYNNGIFGQKGSCSYRDIAKKGTISNSILDGNYNKQALIELLSALASIEGKDLSGTLEDISQNVDNTINTINEISDMVQKGINFLDNLFK